MSGSGWREDFERKKGEEEEKKRGGAGICSGGKKYFWRGAARYMKGVSTLPKRRWKRFAAQA